VRVALFEAAHVLMTRVATWSKLKAWAVAKRRGAKRAKVALARKIGVVLHRMWIDGTDFRFTDKNDRADRMTPRLELPFPARTGIGRDGAEGMPLDARKENSALEIGTLCLRLPHPAGRHSAYREQKHDPEPFPYSLPINAH
jgi:hypothetical protein